MSVAPSSAGLLAQPSSVGSATIPPPNLHFTGWSPKRSHDLTNKVAFVTGGAGGIGRGIVEVLARSGCDVCIIDVNQSEAEVVAARVRSESGRRALVLKADVRSLAEMEAAAAECVKQLGALDICVANAGIVRTGSILTMDEKRYGTPFALLSATAAQLSSTPPVIGCVAGRWHEILEVNLTGTFLTVRACSREMVKLNKSGFGVGGRIITISSANAVLAGAEGGAYCATKVSTFG